MPDYSFVVSPSFNPFSMQEMLVPFSAYKDAFEKSEEQYDTLSQGADKFKYLSETLPEGSKARQIYEGYANDLRAQAEDLAHNGLTMSNRRALTSLKRRYQGEMGRILQADEAMREEKKLRQSLGAQDTSLLYANDNLNIDDFLDGKNPNLYRISGNELYTRGAAAGKAASSRIINIGEGNITLGGYYRDLVSKYGYSPELLNKFRQDINSIPELKAAFDATMEERGVTQNLTGYNRRRAEQSFINGVIDGAVYQENHSPQRDLGVLDAATSEQLRLSAASQGIEKVNGRWQYNPEIDPQYQKAMAVAKMKQDSKGTGSNGGSKYPGYDKLTYEANNGSVSRVDEVSSNARPIGVELVSVKGDPVKKYQLFLGDKNGKEEDGTKLILGTFDRTGEFKKSTGVNYDSFAKYFPKGLSRIFDWTHVYDPEYDDATMRAIARDIIKIANKEGSKAYENYNYYLEPDNSSSNNHGGGFYREPMTRVTGTVFNENLGNFQDGL